MLYKPVIHAGPRTWMLGCVEKHTARPLTADEVEEVCVRLNQSALQPLTLEALQKELDEREERFIKALFDARRKP